MTWVCWVALPRLRVVLSHEPVRSYGSVNSDQGIAPLRQYSGVSRPPDGWA